MIPMLAYVAVETPNWRGFRLWFPLFLAWLLLLLVSPLILLILAAACWWVRVSPWRTIGVLWSVVCATRGTDVHVKSPHALVRVWMV